MSKLKKKETPLNYFNMINAKSQEFVIRWELISYASDHGIRATSRAFDCSRNTVRKWLRRYDCEGKRGLLNRSRAPINIPHKTSTQVEAMLEKYKKRVPYYGARRLKEEFGIPCSTGAITRILKEKGLSRKKKKKYQKKNDLRAVKAKYRPFERLQMDIKYLTDIKHYWPLMMRYKLPKYQFTIRDVKTGAIFLGYGEEKTVTYSVRVAHRLLDHLSANGVDIRKTTIQTDNGSEFSGGSKPGKKKGFVHEVVNVANSNHEFIPPACPNANADVESSHALIEYEFFDIESFTGRRKDFYNRVTTYQHWFNLLRKNGHKGNKTPLDILLEWKGKSIKEEVFLLPPMMLDNILTEPDKSHREKKRVGHHVPELPGRIFKSSCNY